jgi:hypothetical protein
MKRKPYQTSDCEMFWDYSFKILGVCFAVSVNKKTGLLYINKDNE